ncbi:uncharacterized protein DUF899 [Bacillus oleivorans]|uniref:Uncharacterized protein DUF899 n=1 Tax=Bacillus oleivorans TaxID=1448271 RepID=A0A285D5E7_9BACI|nr:DUF899 family protein [Bacillus oleivorans]SNX74393.1 uncharacterized protein DUF899 [Bacillus oleivorans]
MSISNKELPWFFSEVEWILERKKPIEEESAYASDFLNANRSKLSKDEIKKNYVLEGTEGNVSLQDLFKGRNQLIVCHFMFDPSWEQGCPHCSLGADKVSDDYINYMHDRETTFVYVSRAPLTKLEAYKNQKGWSFPWYSSYGSDFNYDFKATTEEGEKAGVSIFIRDGNSIYRVIQKVS